MKKDKSKTAPWRPKGFWQWAFTIFVILPIVLAAWPLTLTVVVIWFFLKQDTKTRKKILKFAGVGIGLFILLGVVTSFFYDEPQVGESAPTPTPTASPTPTPVEACTLDAKVSYSSTQLVVTNLSSRDWINVLIEINSSGLFNSGYSYETGIIKAGTANEIGLGLFTDNDANRFNPYQKAVQSIFIFDRTGDCDFYAEVK